MAHKITHEVAYATRLPDNLEINVKSCKRLPSGELEATYRIYRRVGLIDKVTRRAVFILPSDVVLELGSLHLRFVDPYYRITGKRSTGEKFEVIEQY